MSTQSAKARAEKKVRRQKQVLAVASVVLLVILGFEMTKLLSHGSHEAAPVAPTTTASAPDATPAPSSGWRLPDTHRVVVQRAPDQLISFGLFGSKDPFVQQLAPTPSAPASAAVPAATLRGATSKAAPSSPVGVVITPATQSTSPSSPSAGPSTSPAGPATTEPAPGTSPATPGSATSPSTPTAPAAAPTSVLISTNGVCETVAVKGTFPATEGIFRLVSVARDGKSAQIGIVGGSYDSGQATATLKLGKKLTLVNTQDGTRYVIELKSKCDVVTQPVGAASSPATTTPQSAVPPSPTTTTPTVTMPPTTTTPIVPDPLDTTTTTPTG